MKRRYVRVRAVEQPSGHGSDVRLARIIDVDTGRDIAFRVPRGYQDAIFGARPGARIRLSLFDDPPRLRYRRHRGEASSIRLEPVTFRVMAVELFA